MAGRELGGLVGGGSEYWLWLESK